MLAVCACVWADVDLRRWAVRIGTTIREWNASYRSWKSLGGTLSSRISTARNEGFHRADPRTPAAGQRWCCPYATPGGHESRTTADGSPHECVHRAAGGGTAGCRRAYRAVGRDAGTGAPTRPGEHGPPLAWREGP